MSYLHSRIFSESYQKLSFLFKPDHNYYGHMLRKRWNIILHFWLLHESRHNLCCLKKLSILPILKQVVICGVVAVVIIFSDTECETGLVKVQNVCKETCGVRPCKELIQNICLFLYVSNIKSLHKHLMTIAFLCEMFQNGMFKCFLSTV